MKRVLVTYVKWWMAAFSSYSSVTSHIHSLLPRRLYIEAPRDSFRHRQIHSPRLVALPSLFTGVSCSCSFEFSYHLPGHPSLAFVIMSYTIHATYIQTEPVPGYSVVEETNYREGTWSVNGPEHILTMSASGSSGILRFKSTDDRYFLVALGVHNYKRWCDIVVDAAPTDTAVAIHPEYYNADSPKYQMLWKQLAELEKTTSTGVQIKVQYYKEEEHTLWVRITIT